jgi:uncharacterized protein YjgD (DUF1641 family)
MAKAITEIRKEIPDPIEEQSQAVKEIIQELALNRDAIIEAIHLIKGLNEMKILEAANALLDQRTEVGAIAIQQFNQPTMQNVVKNGINTFKFFGSLKPGQLDIVLEGLSRGFKQLSGSEEQGESRKLSYWRLRKKLWSPPLRAAITRIVDFMDGMGEVFLGNKRESP